MPKMKKNKHLEQKVNTTEFVFLITGIFDFDFSYRYTPLDLKYALNELWLSQFNIELLKKHKPSTTPLKIRSNNDINLQIKIYEEQQRSTFKITSGLKKSLDTLSLDNKNSIRELLAIISIQSKKHFDSFPAPIKYQKTKTDEKAAVYNFFDLTKWIDESIDFSDIPLTTYMKNVFTIFEENRYQKNLLKENQTKLLKENERDGYIEIDTLPKIMQFMIECQQDPTFQKNSVLNKTKHEGVSKNDMVKLLSKASVTRGFSHTRNKKAGEFEGLSNTVLGYFYNFIQNDK